MTLPRQHPQRHSDAGPAGRVQPGDTRSAAAKGNDGTTMPPRKMWLWFLFILFVNYVLVRLLMPGAEDAITVPYTVFKDEVTKGNVQAIYSRGDTITGRFGTPITYPPTRDQSTVPSGDAKGKTKRGWVPPDQHGGH